MIHIYRNETDTWSRHRECTISSLRNRGLTKLNDTCVHTLQFAIRGALVRRITVSAIAIVAYYARGAIFIGVQIFAANPFIRRAGSKWDSRWASRAHAWVRYGNATRFRRLDEPPSDYCVGPESEYHSYFFLIFFCLDAHTKKRLPRSKLLDSGQVLSFAEFWHLVVANWILILEDLSTTL